MLKQVFDEKVSGICNNEESYVQINTQNLLRIYKKHEHMFKIEYQEI